ncbi:type II toxin-antitoxin system HipA family toxin YjjJ [Enterobacteriaceae bacterium H20N1]|uniref:Type II toxin-antitoxin system HipA family toxin YjjJ n=1 Tax=Dryocola boscaweniae TaxID=2925397 RepID=A0A9X2W826_9ENTR|nr:type II toxin-antitoxin system HipA family toxin YjjJ [Dryocola boscaweniae]MCT4701878.1 type II toxin-antitoxin system HipA family toxin YjjJ [Dryocola boscaweniae]MCT4719046.1 type II toxin-antitoxin system HipA family toxin YjjJ [Dryocola boscaweniae]
MSALTDLLLQGPQAANPLRLRLGVSQATFSRLVNAEQTIIKAGQARATRYALIRPVRQIRQFPLWQIDHEGKAWRFGELYPIWPQGSCLVILNNGTAQWFDGLPWYLTDLRPQGFLGRSWGRRLAQQTGLPEDIRLWQEEDVLLALSRQAPENLGGWLVGEESYRRWFEATAPQAIPESDKLSVYGEMANSALAGDIVGSSAGGEQPKFTCYAQTEAGPAQVIVKFTPSVHNENSRRWADLLHAEALALNILNQAGITASRARVLVNQQQQAFLEVVRFDCIGMRGRLGIVSLEAVQCEFASGPLHWPAAMAELVPQKVIETATLRVVQRVWAFGRLIANSDMHAGNLSFYLSDMPLRLAPVYDMLPMAFAPNSAGSMRREPDTPQIDPIVPGDVWQEMLPLARQFWLAASQNQGVSEGFRELSRKMERKLDVVEADIQRLA